MAQVPAICDNCGTVFGSGFSLEGSAYMVGNKSGPCPNCGAMGSIPDGFYEFVGETLRVVATWPTERRSHLAAELRQARRAPDPRAAAVVTLQGEPELRGIAERFLVPRNPSDFWAMVSAIMTLLTLLATQLGGTDEQTVIREIIRQQAPTVPPQELHPPDWSSD